MKQRNAFVIGLVGMLSLFGVPQTVLAAGSTAGTAAAATPTGSIWPPNASTYTIPFPGMTVSSLVARIISGVMPLIGALFFVMVFVGGVYWLTAGDDSKKVEKARRLMTNGVIGMAIVLGAYFIVGTLVGILGNSIGQ
jgi:hypothetical protein